MYYDSNGVLHMTEEEAASYDGPGPFIIDEEGTMPTVEERLAALEKQIPLQTEGLRRVTEGHYNGAQGSGAIVVALEGGQTTIHPQPDPH